MIVPLPTNSKLVGNNSATSNSDKEKNLNIFQKYSLTKITKDWRRFTKFGTTTSKNQSSMFVVVSICPRGLEVFRGQNNRAK